MASARLAAGILASQGCYGQADQWEQVKPIQPDKMIHAKLLTGKSLKGSFTSWNADGLTRRQGGGKVTAVATADVAQVSMLGGVVGGLVAIGCAAGEECSGEGGEFALPGLAMAVLIGAGIAALIPQYKEVIFAGARRAPLPGNRRGGPSVLRLAEQLRRESYSRVFSSRQAMFWLCATAS